MPQYEMKLLRKADGLKVQMYADPIFMAENICIFFQKKYNLPNPKGRDSRSLRIPGIYGAMSGRSL